MHKNYKPEWLKIRHKAGFDSSRVENLLKELHLNTVCDEAACPNRGECFNRKTATFMILGRVCTRNCSFCNVTSGKPEQIDPDEPANIAKAATELGLRHIVITSVTRDDLPDGGSGHFAEVITALRSSEAGSIIEVLIPDFKGSIDALRTVINASPHIINHNVETVPRLYSTVRPQADYKQSLELLERVKQISPEIYTKSGLMLGLGETEEQVLSLMGDLRGVGCDFLTIGQYLAPTTGHHPVIEWVHPDVFESYRLKAEAMGFRHTSSAPLVRSSYLADEAMKSLKEKM